MALGIFRRRPADATDGKGGQQPPAHGSVGYAAYERAAAELRRLRTELDLERLARRDAHARAEQLSLQCTVLGQQLADLRSQLHAQPASPSQDGLEFPLTETVATLASPAGTAPIEATEQVQTVRLVSQLGTPPGPALKDYLATVKVPTEVVRAVISESRSRKVTFASKLVTTPPGQCAEAATATITDDSLTMIVPVLSREQQDTVGWTAYRDARGITLSPPAVSLTSLFRQPEWAIVEWRAADEPKSPAN